MAIFFVSLPKIESAIMQMLENMKKRIFLLLCCLCVFCSIQAQDTLQIMQYNLLNYGNYYGDCTSSNNNVNTKNEYLRTIIEYVQPDVFCVNELGSSPQYAQLLLDDVMNHNTLKYRKAISLSQDSYLINMMYYNVDKLVLYEQDIIHSIVRPIDVYTLYYKSDALAQEQDTIFLRCFVAHLKAGTGDTNEAKRASMVNSAMTYIRQNPFDGNMLFMGDLNLYSSSEQAYINLTHTYSGQRYFYDPINKEGNWNSNYTYRYYHTQSTHASSEPCYSTGGLDDRFDFILANREVLEGSKGMTLLPETYKALGNDGKHFNKSIISSPLNTTLPYDVLQALYHNSDHLPVIVEVAVAQKQAVNNLASKIAYVRFSNPVKGFLNLHIATLKSERLSIDIYNNLGNIVKQVPPVWVHGDMEQIIDISQLSAGVYVLCVRDMDGRQLCKKFVKLGRM